MDFFEIHGKAFPMVGVREGGVLIKKKEKGKENWWTDFSKDTTQMFLFYGRYTKVSSRDMITCSCSTIVSQSNWIINQESEVYCSLDIVTHKEPIHYIITEGIAMA